MFLLVRHFMSSHPKTLIVTLSQTRPEIKMLFALWRPPAVSGHHHPVSEKCVFIRCRPDISKNFDGIWCSFKRHIYLMQEWNSFALIFGFPERNFLRPFLRHNRRWFYHHKTLNIGSRFSEARKVTSAFSNIFKMVMMIFRQLCRKSKRSQSNWNSDSNWYSWGWLDLIWLK